MEATWVQKADLGLDLGSNLGLESSDRGDLMKTLVGTEGGKPFHAIKKLQEDIIYH